TPDANASGTRSDTRAVGIVHAVIKAPGSCHQRRGCTRGNPPTRSQQTTNAAHWMPMFQSISAIFAAHPDLQGADSGRGFRSVVLVWHSGRLTAERIRCFALQIAFGRDQSVEQPIRRPTALWKLQPGEGNLRS